MKEKDIYYSLSKLGCFSTPFPIYASDSGLHPSSLLFFLCCLLPRLSGINFQYLSSHLMLSVLGMNVYEKSLSVIRISQIGIFRPSAFFSRLHIFNITFHYRWQWVEPVPSTNIHIAEQFLFLLTPFVASQFRPN